MNFDKGKEGPWKIRKKNPETYDSRKIKMYFSWWVLSFWGASSRGLEFRVWKVAHWLANQTLNTPRVSKLPTFPLLGFSRNNRQAQVLFRNQAKKRKTRNKWNIVEYDILDPLFSISYFYLSFVCLFSFLLRCPLPRYAAANAQGSIGLFCNLYLYSQHIIS